MTPNPQSNYGTPAQQFALCVILTLIIPVLPLFFEWLFKGDIKLDSLTMAAAMYAMGIGVASKNMALLGVGLLEGIIFSVFYGRTSYEQHSPHDAAFWWAAMAAMGVMFFFHGIERYNRHVRLREPFPDFMRP